jgi:hypothetical protein
MERRRIYHKASFHDRLAQEAQRLKEQAKKLPPGEDREVLLRRIRQVETALNINGWLLSPGLRRPDRK